MGVGHTKPHDDSYVGQNPSLSEKQSANNKEDWEVTFNGIRVSIVARANPASYVVCEASIFRPVPADSFRVKITIQIRTNSER